MLFPIKTTFRGSHIFPISGNVYITVVRESFISRLVKLGLLLKEKWKPIFPISVHGTEKFIKEKLVG